MSVSLILGMKQEIPADWTEDFNVGVPNVGIGLSYLNSRQLRAAAKVRVGAQLAMVAGTGRDFRLFHLLSDTSDLIGDLILDGNPFVGGQEVLNIFA